ncbi:hypothetical protein Pelo_18424 [Pelomyxa schiedti]|nr:hypothetical protein Pelo_18424 [Pelomyxa schiedti]
MWANDWVLTPAREVVFDLPLALGRDPKDRSENPIRRMRYSLYVAVSPTLAVVESYLLTCDRNMQLFGCLGEGKLLCGCDTRWEGIQCSVVNASDPSIAIASLRSVSVGNTKWIAGFEGESTLSLMRVVGGLPTEPVRKLPGIDRGLLQFSPLSDDVVMVFSARFVTLVDLCASFNTQSLAVTGKIESIEGNPKGLLWMPDGTVCTLQGSPGRRTLVDPTTCMTYLLPIDSIGRPPQAASVPHW